MKNEFAIWLETNTPLGQVWTARLLSLAAAVGATALVGLPFIVMAELGQSAGKSAMHARAPAEPALGAPTATVALPVRVSSGDAAASVEIAGDHLRR